MELEYIILLYILGLALLFSEIFVPGGIIGTIGALCLIASIYFVFEEYGFWWGLGSLVLTALAGIVLIKVALRRLTLRRIETTAEGYSSSPKDLPDLMGLEGTTLTMLRPAGKAEISGKRIDVLTRGEIIEQDRRVRVIKVEGNRVFVREAAERETEGVSPKEGSGNGETA
jgi:membrane-bound serine protease (ClpP class)